MTNTAARGAATSPEAPMATHPPRRNGVGTAALVVGVVSLVLSVLVIFAPLGAVLGVAATILGIFGMLRANRRLADNAGQALAGLVTGLIAVVIGGALTISVGTALARHAPELTTFGSCVDDATTAQARETCVQNLVDKLDR